MNFKTIIERIASGQRLNFAESYDLMQSLGNSVYNENQTTALIIALGIRKLDLQELKGFRAALLDLSVKVNLDEYDSIDLCGTGGDEKNTFNISTLASFVVASAGYKVAKHGNYGASSISGSSTIVEKLGYKFSTDQSKLDKELNEIGICFLHAPLFHPALKNVASIRKQLGIKTIFNTLGPLVNPARTKKQLVGVYDLNLARIYHYLLQAEGKEYTVVHSIDGYDEISLTSDLQVFSSVGEDYHTPAQLGFKKNTAADLSGGNTVDESYNIFLNILDNKGTAAQTNTVLINAAAAIQCFDRNKKMHDCFEIAKEALQNGSTKRTIKNLIQNQ